MKTITNISRTIGQPGRAQRAATSPRRRAARWLGALALAAMVNLSPEARAQIDAYDLTGVASPTTTDATVFNANLDSSKTLTRGAGAAASSASNSFRTVGFKNDGIAVTNTDYFQFTLSAASGYTLSLSSIDARYAGTTSFYATPGVSVQYAYSLDGTSFTLIGTAQTLTSTTGTLPTPATINLSGITALQNVVDTTTVTFRFYASGQTTTGGFGFNSPSAGAFGLAIGGALTSTGAAPANYYFDVNGNAAGSGVANNGVYTFSGSNFNSLADGTGTPGIFTAGQTATFSAGADGGTNSYTVNVDTAVSTNGLVFNSGNVTLANAAGGSLTLTGPAISVATGATATISQVIGGTVGLNKTGAGTLTLTGTNGYSGTTTITAGILSVSSDANLGVSTNGIALSGGTLQTTAGIMTGRAFTGTGLLDIAPGTVLASTGVFNTTGVTLANTGTLDLQGTTPALGALAFTAGGTLSSTTGRTATITGLTAPNLASTATVTAALTYAGTSSLAVNVGAGGDLVLNGTIATTGLTGNSSLSKSGAGTLELNGANTGLYRVQIGSASASATTTGGTVVINNANSLGTNQVFLNSGTLNATTDLTGANALPIGLSVGGLAGSTTAATPVPYVPATISGSNVEFAGATSIFETNGFANSLTLNNTTTLSGVVATSNVTVTGGTIARGNGLIVTSTNNGSLVLSGSAPNTFTDAVIVSGSATLNLAKAGALAANVSATVNAGATLLLSGSAAVTDRINNAATVAVNGGGTLHTGGLSEGKAPSGPGATDGVAGVGALTLSGTAGAPATLNFGSATAGSALVFSGLDPASKNAYVTILNWGGTMAADDGTATYDRLLFTSDPGFSTTDLANFTFSGFAPGGAEIAYGNEFEIVPVPEPTTVLGGVLLVGVAAWSQRRRWQATRTRA